MQRGFISCPSTSTVSASVSSSGWAAAISSARSSGSFGSSNWVRRRDRRSAGSRTRVPSGQPRPVAVIEPHTAAAACLEARARGVIAAGGDPLANRQPDAPLVAEVEHVRDPLADAQVELGDRHVGGRSASSGTTGEVTSTSSAQKRPSSQNEYRWSSYHPNASWIASCSAVSGWRSSTASRARTPRTLTSSASKTTAASPASAGASRPREAPRGGLSQRRELVRSLAAHEPVPLGPPQHGLQRPPATVLHRPPSARRSLRRSRRRGAHARPARRRAAPPRAPPRVGVGLVAAAIPSRSAPSSARDPRAARDRERSSAVSRPACAAAASAAARRGSPPAPAAPPRGSAGRTARDSTSAASAPPPPARSTRCSAPVFVSPSPSTPFASSQAAGVSVCAIRRCWHQLRRPDASTAQRPHVDARTGASRTPGTWCRSSALRSSVKTLAAQAAWSSAPPP